MEPTTTEGKNKAGELLKQGRMRQRLSVAECAKRTHIAARYIEALEDERWSDLPSESHRLGFLKLYAHFLGVSSDEILSLYRQHTSPSPAFGPASAPGVQGEKRRGAPTASTRRRWSPSSIPQVVGLGILALLLAWLMYHAMIPRLFEQNPMPWVRRRTTHQARLVVPKATITSHKVRIQAAADSWLRVTSRGQLLFEGILPAGASKEWSGSGPFQFKIGNVRALALFWNDQPVDVLAGARGAINQIRIPPQ